MSDRGAVCARHEEAARLLSHFSASHQAATLQGLGQGLINETFLVESPTDRWVLQRINPEVFGDARRVMRNLRRLLTHVEAAGQLAAPWRFPSLRLTREGLDYWEDTQGVIWRGMEYLEGSRTLGQIQDVKAAREVGRALGWFHALFADLDPETLEDPLPGFHDTRRVLERFDEALRAGHGVEGHEQDAWQNLLAPLRPRIGVLQAAEARRLIKPGVMHGDPKVDNVLFSASALQALSLIDLDTVRCGLRHHDLGDCFRSVCNVSGEEGARVDYDLSLYRSVFEGYLQEAPDLICAEDLAYVFEASWLLPLELGLRFATDHLLGDRYFKARYQGHNLVRARVQFDLVRRILDQEEPLRKSLECVFDQRARRPSEFVVSA